MLRRISSIFSLLSLISGFMVAVRIHSRRRSHRGWDAVTFIVKAFNLESKNMRGGLTRVLSKFLYDCI